MDFASTERRETRCRAWWPVMLLLGSSVACADLLGVPGAPRLISEEPPPSGSTSEQNPATAVDRDLSVSGVTTTTTEGEPSTGREGGLPVAGLGLTPSATPAPDEPADTERPLLPPPPEPATCAQALLPTDLILILDNSGSMAAETAAVERALPGWSRQLAALGLDYRLILLSRHRTRDRSDSEAASTSICVEQPLSGLARCPSAAPLLGERFFHYSIKIDARDSFERALEAFAEPDAAGLAPEGWSAWLRPGALQAFIEISDADSELPAAQLVAGLAALAPEQFGVREGDAPGFIFYSVVGLAEKAAPAEAYLPEEPIERAECRSDDTNPDNAGEQYQALSVLTGGLRLPLCRLAALGGHLERIAEDVALQARRCQK